MNSSLYATALSGLVTIAIDVLQCFQFVTSLWKTTLPKGHVTTLPNSRAIGIVVVEI